MRGQVNHSLEAELTIRVFGPTGSHQDITAVIDTGFSGFLVLPETTALALNLDAMTRTSAVLADGTISEYDTYEAQIEWYGRIRSIDVMVVGFESLIGMKLLENSDLRIEVRAGGTVEIGTSSAPHPSP